MDSKSHFSCKQGLWIQVTILHCYCAKDASLLLRNLIVTVKFTAFTKELLIEGRIERIEV